MSNKCTFCPECSYYSVCSFHLLKEQSLFYLNAIELINSIDFLLYAFVLFELHLIRFYFSIFYELHQQLALLSRCILLFLFKCYTSRPNQNITDFQVFNFIFSKYMKNKKLKIILTVNNQNIHQRNKCTSYTNLLRTTLWSVINMK